MDELKAFELRHGKPITLGMDVRVKNGELMLLNKELVVTGIMWFPMASEAEVYVSENLSSTVNHRYSPLDIIPIIGGEVYEDSI